MEKESNYIVSARKYRPSTFRSVVGQEALTHTLKSIIDSNKLAHAYLFCGPRGVGKTSCARIFAKTINCQNRTAEGEACNECECCRAFNENRSLNIIELDAASNNSVDDIRGITEQVRIPPQVGDYRVFIIDEVHMLSQQAFNAFLKTLEEPPAHVIFILATTEKHKIIPTILSRCQIYDFTRITIRDIVAQLQYIGSQENITADPAALNIIAQKADGAMRDALSIFDQVAASCGGNITYERTIANLNVLDHEYYFKLVDAFLRRDVPAALLIYKDVRDHGFDSQFFINGLAQHLRNIMVAATPQTKCLMDMGDEVAARFEQQAKNVPLKMLYRAMDLCNSCDLNYRVASNKQFLVELTLVKICQILEPQPQAPAPTPPQGGQPAPQRPTQPAPAAPAPQRPVQQAPVAPPPAPPAPAPQRPVQQAPVVPPPPAPPAPAPQRPVQQAPVVPPPPAPQPASGAPSPFARRTPYTTRQAAPAQAAEPQDELPARQTRDNAFTLRDVLVAWQAYANAHPDEKVICSAIKSFAPKQVTDTLFHVDVANNGQLAEFNEKKPALLQFMRDKLQNDNFGIEFGVDASIAASIITPKELAEKIKERNPAFTDLINTFELVLT